MHAHVQVGKVVDIVRHTSAGFVGGSVTLEPLLAAGGAPAAAERQGGCGAGAAIKLEGGEGQGEGELVREPAAGGADAATPLASSGVGAAVVPAPPQTCMVIDFQNENLVARQGGRVVACVPDIITFLDTGSGAAVATEGLRYGLRLAVLALPAHPLLRTPAALAALGPAAVGYQGVQYVPVGRFVQPRPLPGC